MKVSVPEIIKHFIGKANRGNVIAGHKPFKDSISLSLLYDNAFGGVEYEMETEDGKISGWLCSVFWHYFKIAPKRLFIKIEHCG